MNESLQQDSLDFAPAVYFAESLVHCDIEKAWRIMLHYQAWNPNLVGARVTPLKGSAGSEGELVLISTTRADPSGARIPEFYCETIKVVPGRRIVWYSYVKEGQKLHSQQDPFRNFVDLNLTQEPGSVRFNVCFYAQKRLTGDLLSTEKSFMQSVLPKVAAAFRDYCERQDSGLHDGRTDSSSGQLSS